MHAPDDFDPPIGVAENLAPGVRRIVAPNPSPMTYRGTNTYLLGDRDIAVIDPGPFSPAHLGAILGALSPGQRITHTIVTHSHLDHSPLAAELSAATGAPVFAFGGALDGRSDVMARLAKFGTIEGGEGIDHGFRPDRLLADGDIIKGSDWALNVIHTPGHLGNHICLGWNDHCFTGDHVMGWASSLVSPPDGDLTQFMASCARLKQDGWACFYPGHGGVISDPTRRLDWLIDHRLRREAEILAILNIGPSTAKDLASQIYKDIPEQMLAAAERNVLAHLIDLTEKTIVAPQGDLSVHSRFEKR